MRRAPDDELLALVAETNDLRRVAGQALWHLRTLLLLAREKPDRFVSTVRLWATAAGTALARFETRLRRAGPQGRDQALRTWLSGVLSDLARDLPEGDRRLAVFARTLDRRLGEVGRLLRDGTSARRAFDAGLARDLAVALGTVSRASGARISARVAEAADLVRARDPAAGRADPS
jgi:hypothetical protein